MVNPMLYLPQEKLMNMAYESSIPTECSTPVEQPLVSPSITKVQRNVGATNRFRAVGHAVLCTNQLRDALVREDSIQIVPNDGEEGSAAATHCTFASSVGSTLAASTGRLAIPNTVSTKPYKKSCLKLYSKIQDDSLASTVFNGDWSSTTAADHPEVSWSIVQFRTYEAILGDNPSVSAGPPICLGWKYDAETSDISLSIDDYEERRSQRRSKEQLLVPLFDRERTVMAAGYSRSEVNDVVKALQIIKSSRQKNARVGLFEAGVVAIIFRRRNTKIAGTHRFD
jgi:hypothetical protein